jgi:enamine deaminase RidA (YjgF/YER057c/UK114 family)
MIAQPQTNFPIVKKAFDAFFPSSLPSVAFFGMDPGFGANVEVACTGSSPSTIRIKVYLPGVSSPQGILIQTRGEIFLSATGQTGLTGGSGVAEQTKQALLQTDQVFSEAFQSEQALRTSATLCTLVVPSPTDVSTALQVYTAYFDDENIKPTLVVISGGSLPDQALVGIQCFGSP